MIKMKEKRPVRLMYLRLGLAVIMLCLLSSSFYPSPSMSEDSGIMDKPISNNGAKWRIGYSETDPFGNFAGTFYSLITALEKMGWIRGTENIPYSQGQANSKHMWEWLASRDVGPYIEFVSDAHYSLITSPDTGEQMLSRLSNNQDIDLMIAMGTRTGLILAQSDQHQVPTMVFSSSNAVSSGIIQSVEDSGQNHMWAHMDPERYVRQIHVFHDIFEFKKLGLLYEDSEAGRIYAAVDDVRKTAEERDFEIVEQHVNEPLDGKQADLDKYYEEVLAANTKLAQEVDAMFLTYGVWELEKLPMLLQPFYTHNVPVFSQLGAEEVIHGAMMSLSRADFSGVGTFGAQNIAKLFHGVLPRELPQEYGDTPSIVLNLDVAERIDYKAPFEILLAADEVFLDIKGEYVDRGGRE